MINWYNFIYHNYLLDENGLNDGEDVMILAVVLNLIGIWDEEIFDHIYEW